MRSRSNKKPTVECYGGPLDGLVCQWPLSDGAPASIVKLCYATFAESDDGTAEIVDTDYRTAVYEYVTAGRAEFRTDAPATAGDIAA